MKLTLVSLASKPWRAPIPLGRSMLSLQGLEQCDSWDLRAALWAQRTGSGGKASRRFLLPQQDIFLTLMDESPGETSSSCLAEQLCSP